MKKLITALITCLILSTNVFADSTYVDTDTDRLIQTQWYSDYDMVEYTYTARFEHQLYKQFKDNNDRSFTPITWNEYINEPYNRYAVKEFAETMRVVQDKRNLNDFQIATDILRFVQNIPYKSDIESKGNVEWPKYPIETIYENEGDCEDKTILLAGILREYGFDVIFILFNNHIAVGINADLPSGVYIEHNNKRYFVMESSSPGWNIGECSNIYISATPIEIGGIVND